MPDERWIAILGYEGLYEISDQGRVRGLDRVIIRSTGSKYTVKGAMKAVTPGDPYPIVTLKNRGAQKTIRVHQLVMRAFVGPCPSGLEVCHEDGDCTNNRLENLRYDTRTANHADKKRHGTSNTGSRHGNSKLAEDDVLEIRAAYARGGETYKSLGARYGVNPYQIGLIIRRQRWTHI